MAETPEGVLAYACATRWHARAAYDRTVETRIYVRDEARGSGLGIPFYLALLEDLRRREFHAAVGCIARPNPASVAFHEKCGFQAVARFPQVGRKFERRINVGFWQLHL